MRRRDFVSAALLAGTTFPTGAQVVRRTPAPRVVVLASAPFSHLYLRQALPGTLRELGYAEGENITLEWRSAEGRVERLDSLAAEVVASNPDLIVAVINAEIRAVRKLTSSIPIVMVAATAPVEAGFAASMTRPGGNITGGAFYTPEFFGKMLAVFKEGVPRIERVAALPSFAAVPGVNESLQDAGRKLGIVLRVFDVARPDSLEEALADAVHWGADSFFVNPFRGVGGRLEFVLAYMLQHRVPALYGTRGMVDGGGLMGYVPSALEGTRRVARYVDRILKGAKPGDLPLEQPVVFDLILNLKTARAIRLEFAPSFLATADELIE